MLTEETLFAPGQTLHAPHLLDLEVVHILHRYEAARVIDAQASRRVTMSMGRCSWQRCPVLCDPHTFKNGVVWSFALILAWRKPASYNE
jgi:hypothetical protein